MNGVQRLARIVHFLSARRDLDTSTGLEATDGGGDALEAQAAWHCDCGTISEAQPRQATGSRADRPFLLGSAPRTCRVGFPSPAPFRGSTST